MLRPRLLPLVVAALAMDARGALAQRRNTQPGAVLPGSRALAPNKLTRTERDLGWRLLFDGVSTAGWRGSTSTTPPAGWQVRDGALTRVGPGGDLLTAQTFANFELSLEWKIAPGGNSGILYRVADAGERAAETGPEMQLLDDERNAEGRSPLTAAGAAYGVYPAPGGRLRPVGEWNRVRLIVNGTHVEHWLNGARVVQYELGSPDWARRVKDSKFAQWPAFGRATRGHIALEDHGDRIAFRNIKIREIK